MKRHLTILALLTITSPLFAAFCGNLGITITNETDNDCVLRNTRVDSGLFQDQTPMTIPSHSTSPTFYMVQDSSGVAVQIDYRCDKKVAMFYSSQDYCGFSAGYVQGFSYYTNDLSVDHQIAIGSYWAATPGQISWRIH